MKKLIFSTSPESSFFSEVLMTLARVATGLMMAFGHGWSKMPPPDRLVEGVGAMGFPFPVLFAWSASLSEFAGGLLIAIGLATRPSALFLAITMTVAAFVAHAADPFERKEMALLYLVLSLIFVARGSGKFSVDHLIGGK